MKIIELGSHGLATSKLGLGCMGMSFGYAEAPEDRSIATIHRAIDLGVTLLDTANMYGPETNERLIARAVAGRRESVTLATKFGNAYDQDDRAIDGRPEYVRSCCEGSLSRLGVDHIDLYYQHRVDPDVPIEDTVGAMAELVEQGKVRYLGLSEAAPATIRRAHAVHPISALQSEYSLFTRDPEAEVLATVRELGIGFVAYSPLGRGFLTGTITSPDDLGDADHRKKLPRFQQETLQRNLELVELVRELAREKGVSAAQLALAWLCSRGEDVVPLAGTTRPERVEENAAAVDIEFTDEELARVDEIAPLGAAAGDRLPEALMGEIDR